MFAERVHLLRRALVVGALSCLASEPWGGVPGCENCLDEGTHEKGCINQFGNAVSCSENFMPGTCPPPPGCDPTSPSTFGNCKGISTCNCSAAQHAHLYQQRWICVPENPFKGCPQVLNPNGTDPACRIFPIRPKNAVPLAFTYTS